MSPNILIYGFAVFAVCLSAHIVLWRFRIPRNDAMSLFVLFLLLPLVVFVVLWGYGLHRVPSGPSGTELFLVLVLHGALSMVYIASYPAAQAISPSLQILLLVHAARDREMTSEEVFRYFEDQQIILRRIEELVDYNLVAEEQGRYRLKPGAARLIRMYLLYRRLLGLPVGRG